MKMSNFKCPISNVQRGFSILEMLLYVAMIGLIMLTVASLLTTMLKGRAKNQSIAEVEQQGTFTLNMITQSIRNAASVSVPSAGASGTTLTFINGSGTSQTFDLSGSTLRFNDGTGAIAITNSHVAVSGLSFQNLKRSNADGTVKITFTLSYSSASTRNEFSYSKTFYGMASLR